MLGAVVPYLIIDFSAINVVDPFEGEAAEPPLLYTVIFGEATPFAYVNLTANVIPFIKVMASVIAGSLIITSFAAVAAAVEHVP